MLEAIAAAVATALLGAASTAAIAAARKSGETRDAVLILQSDLRSLDGRVMGGLAEIREHAGRINEMEGRIFVLESKVSALEAGVIDRRQSQR